MENVRETTAPACDCQICNVAEANMPEGPLRVYTLIYDVQGVGKGNAVIKAANPKAAENILKSNGVYNGTPYLYKIKKVEELITPPCAGLMAESVVTIKEVMEDSYMS